METVASKIYQNIKEKIIEGTLSPGVRITEQGIAESFKSSRTPVREAIRGLAADGFLIVKANSTTVVRGWEQEEIIELFTLRSMLESELAAMAAINITPQDIQKLVLIQTEIERQGPNISAENTARITPLNRDFHQIIHRAAQSERLVDLLQNTIEVPIVQQTFRRYNPAEMARSFGHHRELIDALDSRDASWAKSVMNSHIRNAKRVLMATQSTWAAQLQPVPSCVTT
jgi:DNA-binding GntR family transcriptional regulator